MKSKKRNTRSKSQRGGGSPELSKLSAIRTLRGLFNQSNLTDNERADIASALSKLESVQIVQP
jgi:hypothetical protein